MKSDTVPRFGPTRRRVLAAAALLATAVFVLDLFLPLGFGHGMPYVVPLLLALWSPSPGFILLMAAGGTVLTAAGGFLSPPGDPNAGVLHRLPAVLVLWLTASILLVYGRARARFKAKEREARAYLEVAQVAFVVLDREGNVEMINRKGCEILGYGAGEIVGRNWFRSFLPERIAAETSRVFEELMAGGVETAEYYENPVRRRDGSERIVAWHNTLLRDARGQIAGTLSSGEDVTERRRAEEAMRRRETLARVGQLAAVVAHEVRNPLAAVRGAIQILERRLPEADRAIVPDILERIDGLTRLTQDLLLFARPHPPRMQPVGLGDLLHTTAGLLALDPELKGVEVSVSGGEATVAGDAELLGNLFLNLFLNAAQAMGGQGTIRVDLTASDGGFRIAIGDSGPGIPPDLRERVFEPFFTTKHRGTGLGLAIARQVVEAHGGQIAIDSPPAGGTTVVVRLPGADGGTA